MISHPESHSERFAVRFQDQSVVDRYHLRPTYPPETFTILNELIVDEPRTVLDVGCGTGNIARPLAEYVERVDAVDFSLPMLLRARTLPGGDSPKIRWLPGRAEEVETQPPYALITAGESLHWMDWGVILLVSHGKFRPTVCSLSCMWRNSPFPGAMVITRLCGVSPTPPAMRRSIGSANWRNTSYSRNWANARPRP